MPKGGSQEWSARYRIDIETKKWCDAECKSVFDIPVLDSEQIVVLNEHPGPNESWVIWFNRRTGEYSERMHLVPGLYFTTKGMCERADFSGFTKQKF